MTTPTTQADADLWQLITEDDHAAFTELFERHAEAVWNYAYRLTASWATAEDMLSATFLTAWRKRGDGVLVRESALPWLYTVTANLVRTEWRAGRRRLRMLSKLSAEHERDHADDVADRLHARQHLQAVIAAVDRLPRAEREVARLCLLGELSITDTAAALGIAEASVRSRVSRARARLRDLTARNPHD
ncbi:DNA-directed RNA polymerase sigma-70 factor [Lentzea sp. NBRC 105346]|uniref:RNA polymerase sigma factor n=1 Tax=Lentzea sp. NBRC 105346 TaxID=3032205 RepID=UPI0024A1DE3F|nr:RNA polymerase sigma factor [Lentzea sp. NBRC 105346]GLZ28277.1 DNA-directed RNA polymerase sigma-70 factor [Lentzea sp. NBRC 105346]